MSDCHIRWKYVKPRLRYNDFKTFRSNSNGYYSAGHYHRSSLYEEQEADVTVVKWLNSTQLNWTLKVKAE